MEEIFRRVERFHAQFLEELEGVYQSCIDVVNITAWYNRLDQLTSALGQGHGTYRQVEDHIFELKIINYLRNSFPECVITYEPIGLSQDGKNCDLEVVYKNKRYLVEVKCFHPGWKNANIPKQHIAKNNTLIMDGKSYHTYQATRGHLIDVTRHTEQKLKNYKGEFLSVLAVPDGFYLDVEDFRDFIFIYRNGQPRPDDPLGPMTMHNLEEPFEGVIDQFWAFPFIQESFSFKPDKTATVVAPLIHEDQNLVL